ncbi:LysM peptidoglycan-binding domain-containing protein [Glycomyces sp. NRRL B-16210]|uniref:LysM peptidoglycan-binding domain-containing protein n=1 Tax=Glycomyces sp. NRRL B-16210 TaxID=1463821 RepID=UPI0004C174E9|nr:hypothetical protein [Glycomyces sp. NRRL B-16210]
MKLLNATSALLAIAVLLAGPPTLLVQAGWPLPDHLPGLEQLWAVATRPLSDRLLLNAVVVLGWVLWAAVLRAFAAELWFQVRHANQVGTFGVRARGPLRWVAAALIAAVVSAGPAAAALPAEAEPLAAVAMTDPAGNDTASTEPPVRPQQDGTEQVVHVVERGDTLWDIPADEDYLADPLRYPEIFDANEGVIQGDGRALQDEHLIYLGWELTIPTDTDTDTDTDINDDEAAPEAPQEDDAEPEPTTVEPNEPTAAPTETPSETPSANDTDLSGLDDGLAAPLPATATGAGADWFQAGIWLTAGTFLAATTGFSIMVLLRRRLHDREHDPDNDRTLTGRLADLEALFDHEEHAPPLDTVMPLAANTNHQMSTEVSLLDWAADGLGLHGPGAPAALRATLINAASHLPVAITTSAAETIHLDPTTTAHGSPSPPTTTCPRCS